MAYLESEILVWPMAAMVFLIYGFGFYLFLVRSRAVRKKQLSLGYFRAYGGACPEDLLLKASHYNNFFQVPMLFLITCLVNMHVQAVNPIVGALAWGFVISRVCHSWIHLGKNNVLRRAFVFWVGCALVLGMWVNIIVKITLFKGVL